MLVLFSCLNLFGQNWRLIRIDGSTAIQLDADSLFSEQRPDGVSCTIWSLDGRHEILRVRWRFRQRDNDLMEYAFLMVKRLRNGRWETSSVNDPGKSLKWQFVISGSMEDKTIMSNNYFIR